MKITNITMVNILNILNHYGAKKLPQKISYAITKNLMSFTNEYKVYEKQLNQLYDDFKEYTVKDDNGKEKKDANDIPIIVDDMKERFEKELQELLNFEIEIEIYEVKPEVFDYDDSERFDALSAQDIMNLQTILCKNDSKTDETE